MHEFTWIDGKRYHTTEKTDRIIDSLKMGLTIGFWVFVCSINDITW